MSPRSEHSVLDTEDVFLLRASGGETEVRLRSRTPLVDVRPIGEVAPLLERFGFVRIHREHAVNIVRIRQPSAAGRWQRLGAQARTSGEQGALDSSRPPSEAPGGPRGGGDQHAASAASDGLQDAKCTATSGIRPSDRRAWRCWLIGSRVEGPGSTNGGMGSNIRLQR